MKKYLILSILALAVATSAFFIKDAFAAGAPIITFPSIVPWVALGPTDTTIGFQFGINWNGAPTTYSVEYGTTLAYGSVSTTDMSGYNTTSGTGTAQILVSGLTCNTLYHMRAKASNSYGTTYSTDWSRSTAACTVLAPVVATNAATVISQTGAILNGNLTSGGGSTTTARFEYGQTTAYGSTTIDAYMPTNGVYSLPASGLFCGTLYHFRAKATAASSGYGTDLTFTTTPCTPPAVTTNAASGITTAGATLNGNLTSMGGATTVSFDYGTTVSYGSATASSTVLSTGAFSQPVSGLACATTYHFRAKAVGTTTVYGSDLTFTTSPCVPLTVCAPPAAGSAAVLHGYAWSSTIGWVSMNCAESPGATDYRVSINNSTGAFSGYAWSSNVGWIGFNSADVAACGAQAVLNTTTNVVTGWARVLSGTVASGADGCINLGNTSHGDGLVFSPGVPVAIGSTTLPGSQLAQFQQRFRRCRFGSSRSESISHWGSGS